MRVTVITVGRQAAQRHKTISAGFFQGDEKTGGDGADLVIGTFSKALGSFGAYVACSETLRDYLARVRRVGDAEVVTVTTSSAALCATGLAD